MSDVRTKLLQQKRKDIQESEDRRRARIAELHEIGSQASKLLGSRVCAAEQEDSVALYTVSEENVVAPLTELQFEAAVYATQPHLSNSDRKEIAAAVKLSTLITNPLELSTVQPVSWADEATTLTWNRLPMKRSELANVTLEELPAFAHVLALCDDPDALVLWIGSLLDPHAGRTQYLHMHGGGGNGKSTLFAAIASVLGEKHVVTTRADEFSNQHWGSILEGKRLLVFPDENNPGFFSTGKFKEFTGEQVVTVNPKYEKPRTIRLTHKTAVFSNNRVEISDSVADRRRLLSISMADDPDGNIGFRWWYEELKSSGSKILAYCFAEYEAACRRDASVRAFIPQSKTAIEAAIDRKYAEIVDTITSVYQVTGNSSDAVRRVDLHYEICDALKERRTNRVFMQQLREALRRLGVTEVEGSYVGLRRGASLGGKPTTPQVIQGGKK